MNLLVFLEGYTNDLGYVHHSFTGGGNDLYKLLANQLRSAFLG